MVEISEITSDDGSNGGDPNKNPQEEENQNEEPQQQVQNLPIPQQVENLRIPEDLPDEINEHILTLVERCDYPSLLCTSKAFRQIITSPRLFEARSQLGRTECVLYAFIGFYPSEIARWYILHRRNNSLRLSIINSLPPMILGSAVVTIGHDMYIFGGKLGSLPPVSNVFVIDCRFHTWRCLPDMRRARYRAAAGVVDGKIYVIGGCNINRGGNWIEVFDVKKQIWETVHGLNPNITIFYGDFFTNVVMEKKIHILDGVYCLAYEPRRCKWESWGSNSPQRRFWDYSSCVIDDMLYSIDPPCFLGYPIVVYDPRDVVWRPVKGVRMSDLLDVVYFSYKLVNLGGKLVILGSNSKSWLWCIEIALERRGDGEIWGNVESKSRVLSCVKSPIIDHSRTVTV